jgi:RNase H-fold protein (predicted Holliday junction resolvase)
VGVAVSDDGGALAFPRMVVLTPEALAAIGALVKEEGIGMIVLGESKNFAGEPNAVMGKIDEFKKELAAQTGLPVEYEQELFSSALAARQFAPGSSSGTDRPRMSRKAHPSQEMLDDSAAAVILQSYLDKRKKKVE